MFGKFYVSDATPCCFSEANLSKFSATLEAPGPCQLIFVVVAVVQVSLNVD